MGRSERGAGMPDVGGFVGDCGRSVKPCERDHRDERSVSERRWSSVREGGHRGSAVVVDILMEKRGGCMGKRSGSKWAIAADK